VTNAVLQVTNAVLKTCSTNAALVFFYLFVHSNAFLLPSCPLLSTALVREYMMVLLVSGALLSGCQ
jgi:hypothetical protein